jgi:NitT/TauT family transport system ATP-binding protein
MKRRVALARALLLTPELLLLDEPLAGLDVLTRTQLMEEVARVLHEFGSTTVIVTHSVEEAVFWGSRVLLLSPRPGTIIEALDYRAPQPRQLRHLETEEFHALAAQCRRVLLGPEPKGRDA